MSAFSLEKIFGIKIRESANDGSDFTSPDADYRMLFLGEDGQLHVKDSAGAVTDIGGTAAGAAYPLPTVVLMGAQFSGSSTSCAATVTAPTTGDKLVAIVYSTGRGANSITQTNVTWTLRYTG